MLKNEYLSGFWIVFSFRDLKIELIDEKGKYMAQPA